MCDKLGPPSLPSYPCAPASPLLGADFLTGPVSGCGRPAPGPGSGLGGPYGSRLSHPSCQDLGIPYADFSSEDDVDPVTSYAGAVGAPSGPGALTQGTHYKEGANPRSHHPMFRLNGMTYDVRDPNNPFSPYCRIPLPSPFGSYEYGFEPAFIRKRNERERERVRCVNEGYLRLRQHLPLDNKDKRISKVETLRCAISYIEHLQSLLADLDSRTTAAFDGGHDDQGPRDTGLGAGTKRPSGQRADDDEPPTKRTNRSGFDARQTDCLHRE